MLNLNGDRENLKGRIQQENERYNSFGCPIEGCRVREIYWTYRPMPLQRAPFPLPSSLLEGKIETDPSIEELLDCLASTHFGRVNY